MDVRQIPGYRSGSFYYTCDADRGYFYKIKSRKPNGTNYLVCIEKNCPARAICIEAQFVKLGENHQHPSDAAKEEALRLKDTMIRSAVSSSDQIKTIYVHQSAR